MKRLLTTVLGMLILCIQLMAQSRTITGRVTNENGSSEVGASVQVLNTQVGTVTKEDGTFSLSVPANAKTLVISALGMATQEITLGSQTNLSISLRAGAQQNLQEVVVVGYGTQRRRSLTGAV